MQFNIISTTDSQIEKNKQPINKSYSESSILEKNLNI
uniref:Uncharacterized protein n=1 Tax=Anguilla anguilla TaxID=7936 RepID=A0A0E9P676_ANGAN